VDSNLYNLHFNQITMKTALQELIEWMTENEFMVNKKFINKVNQCFEKEKEQIINFHVTLMKKGLEQEGNGIEWDYDELRKEAEQHYDETYNKNK
jgi:hypothetical protein